MNNTLRSAFALTGLGLALLTTSSACANSDRAAQRATATPESRNGFGIGRPYRGNVREGRRVRPPLERMLGPSPIEKGPELARPVLPPDFENESSPDPLPGTQAPPTPPSPIAIQDDLPGAELLLNIGASSAFGRGVDLRNQVANEIPYAQPHEAITIYAYADGGAYPRIKPDGTVYYNGIPQLADMALHEAKLTAALEDKVPEGFTGVVCIDYESWWPLWEWTAERYQTASLDYAKTIFGPDATVEEAKVLYEDAAQFFLTETIRIARQVRPTARFGYYNLPTMLPHVSQGMTPEEIHQRLQWMEDVVDVAMPSLYTGRKIDENPSNFWETTVEERQSWMDDRLVVCELFDMPIYAFTWLRYHDANEQYGGQFLEEADIDVMFAYTAERVQGWIVWDWYNDAQLEADILQHIRDVFIPFLTENVTIEPGSVN